MDMFDAPHTRGAAGTCVARTIRQRDGKFEAQPCRVVVDRFDREKELSVGFEEFIDENGKITLPEGNTLLDHLEQNTASNGDELAYRYIDYSRERDGEVHELTWNQFGVRLKAIAARLQQVTHPGDRVAILAPQGLDYVVSFFAAIYAGVIAVPLWIPQLGYSGGLVILFIAFVDELVHVLRGFAPRYELPKPQSAEEIVERAMQSGV